MNKDDKTAAVTPKPARAGAVSIALNAPRRAAGELRKAGFVLAEVRLAEGVSASDLDKALAAGKVSLAES